MSKAERQAFLADLHVGVISIADDRGRAPLTAPIWYRYEPGGDVVMNIAVESVKARLLAGAGRASLCVQNEPLPYAYVTVEGPVALSDGDEGERRLLAERYLGELAPPYLESTAGEATLTARLTPEHWLSQDYGKMDL
jgi:nitroimidazol reductase NimA-like FMN-containing flavoprotein (pyridoxamine 5'-phosphate oxidase superfamily)